MSLLLSIDGTDLSSHTMRAVSVSCAKSLLRSKTTLEIQFFSISKITWRQNNLTAAACLLKRDFCERKDQLRVHATTELCHAPLTLLQRQRGLFDAIYICLWRHGYKEATYI